MREGEKKIISESIMLDGENKLKVSLLRLKRSIDFLWICSTIDLLRNICCSSQKGSKTFLLTSEKVPKSKVPIHFQ